MAHSIQMPKVAMAMNEGRLAQWLMEPGAQVKKGDLLLSIETEKTAYEVESTGSGFLHIVVQEGETVPIHTEVAVLVETKEELAVIAQRSEAKEELAVIAQRSEAKEELAAIAQRSEAKEELAAIAQRSEEKAVSEASALEPPAATPVAAAPTAPQIASLLASSSPVSATDLAQPSHTISLTPRGHVRASPLARRIAKQSGFDLRRIPGTGPYGRIKKRDIEKWLAARKPATTTAHQPIEIDGNQAIERERIPVIGMREAIRSRMLRAINEQVLCSGMIEIEMEALIRARETYVQRTERLGTKVSLQAFFIKALAKAALDVPIINARMDEDEIIVFNNVNVSLAVAVEGGHPLLSGLMVPVLSDAHAKGIVQINQEMQALIEGARNGSSLGADSSHGTITLSSVSGIMPGYSQTTPILNAGQAYIGQPGNIVDRPVVRDGNLVPGKIMTWSYGFDHRVLDGAPACEFHTRLKEYLENPELLLA